MIPDGESPAPGSFPRAVLGLLVVVLIVGAAIAGTVMILSSQGEERKGFDASRIAEIATADDAEDPFQWEPDRSDGFAERAALAYAHILYEKSPGGIVASVRRTARYRGQIERAANEHGVDADTMEGMVLLESAGRPDVIAGSTADDASGLAQIVGSTGVSLLGMDIDLQRSRAITRQLAENAGAIERAQEDAASNRPKVRAKALLKLRRLEREQQRLIRERRSIDARFRPADALDGMGTYLQRAGRRFGDPDLATVSYHMGIGNLETAIGDYLGTDASGGAVGGLVAEEDMTYARLFFDSSPLEHPEAWDLLSSLGDDSSTYLWRVDAAERIMSMYREDPQGLRDLAALQTAKATQEEVLHPEDSTEVFADAAAIQAARDESDLIAIPTGGDYGYRVDKDLGELAPNFGVEPALYRALRPEALATLIYMTEKVRQINDGKGVLHVSSAVRDQRYQDQLVGVNSEATPNYSLHTTGYAFDIPREYSSDSQAVAFQFVLDRLRALNVIDYAVEPSAIHVVVGDEAQALLRGQTL